MSNQIPDPKSLILAMAKEMAPTASLDPIMIGIHTGGLWVAERLYTELNLSSCLDLSNYLSANFRGLVLGWMDFSDGLSV